MIFSKLKCSFYFDFIILLKHVSPIQFFFRKSPLLTSASATTTTTTTGRRMPQLAIPSPATSNVSESAAPTMADSPTSAVPGGTATAEPDSDPEDDPGHLLNVWLGELNTLKKVCVVYYQYHNQLGVTNAHCTNCFKNRYYIY